MGNELGSAHFFTFTNRPVPPWMIVVYYIGRLIGGNIH
jgi:hypothetical protein